MNNEKVLGTLASFHNGDVNYVHRDMIDFDIEQTYSKAYDKYKERDYTKIFCKTKALDDVYGMLKY